MATNTAEKLEPTTFVVSQQNQPLHDSVRQALENYFSQLKGQAPNDLYERVLAQIEEPLLQCVMDYTKNNQSKAAIVLGLSRGTLRKKLKQYGMLD
jgi:Fis family transcriptional regulator, factor for inversion stimulation protein